MKKKRPRKTADSPKKSAANSPHSSLKTKSTAKKEIKTSRTSSKKKTPLSPRVRGLLSRSRIKIAKTEQITVEPLSHAVDSPSIPLITDLPFSYNQTRLELLVRDPYWVFAFWDFSGETWNWIVTFRERDHTVRSKLRIHNLDSGTSKDIDIYLEAKNWYIELEHPDCSFEAELGFLDSGGKFHAIVRSNRIRSPRNGPSSKIDPEWSLTDFELSELYRLSGGGTGYSPGSFSSFKRRSS